jgi:anti-sigma factor RsiW
VTCREFTEFLMAYLAGELPADERARFDEHLAGCDDCVAYLQTYKDTVRLSAEAFADPDAAPPADVPDDLVRAVLAALGRKP